jgi:DNA-binding IclR family transcriptional regulator
VRDPQAEPSDLIRSVSRALRVLEAVGQSPRGLTVKQIARRCDFTVATTYHLVRTLAYEGYVIRRENGTYVVGLQIADRYRELVLAFRGPSSVLDRLRRAAAETGYSHYLGRFVGGRVAVIAAAEGTRTPPADDLVPGFDDAAHATALGKALLATLTADQRWPIPPPR